jgi:uncharacterized membrane protein YdjX (TVP38/TMEM64 family)
MNLYGRRFILFCWLIRAASFGNAFHLNKVSTERILFSSVKSSWHRVSISSSSSSSSSPSSPSPFKKQHQQFLTPPSKEEAEQVEEVRLNIWKNRRGQVRSMLRNAESLRNFRLARGLWVPELDPETGKPIKSSSSGDNGKLAVTVSAFALATGAILLRIGGRAALVSAVGLDFLTDNAELQGQVNQVLDYTETMDPLVKSGIFCLGWTLTKVFCFDAAGIVLALSSGILFGGVLPGTLMSAFGATVGSSVAFALAKADTPIRKKALELVQDNPSLRGIEKVVAEDGLKAVLTLRLAPILPIPLGMYNYVYGISNVKYIDFAGGIFLGSLKPYLLDAYLGYFGKTLVDGTAGQDGGLQDYILIAVLGVSVLIGVFASQLASETWDAVLEEQKEDASKNDNDKKDDVVTEIFGQKLPPWMVGFQYTIQQADERMTNLVYDEYDAKFWNVTESQPLFGKPVSTTGAWDNRNPALKATSPEVVDRYKGIDMGASICDGLMLSPILFNSFLQIADPLFDEEVFQASRRNKMKTTGESSAAPVFPTSLQFGMEDSAKVQEDSGIANAPSQKDVQTGKLLSRLQSLRGEAQQNLERIDLKIEGTRNSSTVRKE